MSPPIKLAVGLALLQACHAIPVITSWMKYAQEQAAIMDASAVESGVSEDPSMHWFTQKLDHYDRQVTKSWQQRSFQNDTFFDGTGPVFICVGGEGPAMDASVLVASVHCNDMVRAAAMTLFFLLLLLLLFYFFWGGAFALLFVTMKRSDRDES